MSRSPVCATIDTVASIETPHPVYGLQWTADGRRLVFSGGFLYGGGFLGLANRDGEILGLRDSDSLSPEPAIDGRRVILPAVCSDDSGSWILVAACSYKWHTRGPLLFRWDGNSLVLAAALALPEDEDDGYGDSVDRATGAWIDHGELLVRYVAGDMGDVLLRWPAPEAMHADSLRSAQSSSRVAVIEDVAWVAKNQRSRYSVAGTGPPMSESGSDFCLVLEPHGLVAVDRSRPGEPTLHALDRSEFCQALIRDHAGKRLFAGLRDHRIVEWRIVDRTRLDRVRSWPHVGRGCCGAPIARGIQALCQLADGTTLVSGEVSGSIALWRDATCVGHFVLPDRWSPRCLAAHPSEPLLAVGCKGESGYAPGSVHTYDLSRF